MIEPLAIVQARYGSTRLPGKVLLDVQGQPLLVRVWRETCRAVGPANVVIAYPDTPDNAPIAAACVKWKMRFFAYAGAEDDVLGRFWIVAHTHRWHPDTVILRVTPDDPWKRADAMRRVIGGERLPVEVGGEAFTLAMLDAAFRDLRCSQYIEHIGNHPLLFPVKAPAPGPAGGHVPWTIDTEEDYRAVLAAIGADRWPGDNVG